jgi:hypothetical protein
MRETHTPTSGEGASLSRRNFIAIAAAGTAATLPAGVLAAASGKTARLSQPLETQIDECVARLRDLLTRMYPSAEKVHTHLGRRDDGSFRFCIQGDVKFQPFQGNGIYIVSRDGSMWEYLVREEPVVTLSGRSLGYSHYWGRARCDDGGWDDCEIFVTNFVRKIGELPS